MPPRPESQKSWINGGRQNREEMGHPCCAMAQTQHATGSSVTNMWRLTWVSSPTFLQPSLDFVSILTPVQNRQHGRDATLQLGEC